MNKKQRLVLLLFILLGVSCAVGLLFFALGQNMNHYYELSLIKNGQAPTDKPIRIGGLVEKGSVIRVPETLTVQFVITDFRHQMSVSYTGILPNLFRDGQGVLAKGKLIDKNHFQATEILAKHDENYMPKAVKESLEKSGLYQHTEQGLNVP